MRNLILVIWMICSLSAFAGGKKERDLVIQFHLQGSSADGPRMSVPQDVAGTQVFFRVSPEIATRDIRSFRPFPSDDGYSYGLIFQLDDTAARRLASVTNLNQGSLMMARLSGRPAEILKIDKMVSDGVLVIWQGVTTLEIEALDKIKPRIGQTVQEWKKQKKEKK